MDRAEVADAIRRSLQPYLPLLVPAPKGFVFIGEVVVRGILLRYRAHPLSEVVVNVGRVTGP